MLFAHFISEKEKMWGVVEGNLLRVLEGNPFEEWNVTEKVVLLNDVTLLAPCNPTKIVGVGLNYRDHAKELGMKLPEVPVIFLKPPSAVIGHGQKIVYPSSTRQVEYEAELAVIIKKTARNVALYDADKYILGFTCANDVTARDLQKKDSQWTRAKSFDTFCPLGPYLAVDLQPDHLKIKLMVNGEIRQDSSTSEMIFNVVEIVSFVSSVMTLYPGDVIITGTPSGVGPLNVGDVVSVEIEGIGILTNEVVSDLQASYKNIIDKT